MDRIRYREGEMDVCRAVAFGTELTIPAPLIMGMQGWPMMTVTAACVTMTLLLYGFLASKDHSTIPDDMLKELMITSKKDPETAATMDRLLCREPSRITYREYESIASEHNERASGELWKHALVEARRRAS